jgi:hypothetical protein
MPWLNSVVLIEAENLVISRGPVGVVTSHALLEKNFRVLNVDIGTSVKLSTQDLIVNSNINYTAAVKPPSLVKETNEHLWGGACMGWQYFQENAFPVALMPGLPISEVQFDQASKKLKKILMVSNFNFSKDRPNFNLQLAKPKGLNFVFAKIVKDPYMTRQIEVLHSNPNYKLLTNILIHQVIDKGTHLECQGKLTDSDQEVKIVCKRVFLAAGTISNTIILSQSKLQSLNRNFLGNFLSDHISLPIASAATRDLLRIEKLFGYKKTSRGTKLWPRVKIQSADDEINSLDTFCYVTEVVASTGKGQRILALLRRFPTLQVFFKMKVEGKYQLNLFSEVSNSASNGIRPDDASEKFQINFMLGLNDLYLISKIANGYIENFLATPMMKNGSAAAIFNVEEQLQSLQAGSHPSGTYRMSANPEEGVINSFSQLHSHPNIFVLGAGAFPRSAATHPTFTAMALALIAVDSIND